MVMFLSPDENGGILSGASDSPVWLKRGASTPVWDISLSAMQVSSPGTPPWWCWPTWRLCLRACWSTRPTAHWWATFHDPTRSPFTGHWPHCLHCWQWVVLPSSCRWVTAKNLTVPGDYFVLLCHSAGDCFVLLCHSAGDCFVLLCHFAGGSPLGMWPTGNCFVLYHFAGGSPLGMWPTGNCFVLYHFAGGSPLGTWLCLVLCCLLYTWRMQYTSLRQGLVRVKDCCVVSCTFTVSLH